VLQQERLALVRVEPRQRSFDLLPPRRRIRGMIERDRVVPILRRDESLLVSRAPSARGSAAIGEDREQPTAEARRVAASVQRAIRTHERILQRLLGIFAIAEHVQRESRISIPVPGHEPGVRFGLAPENDVHERGVRKLHRMRDPGTVHGVTVDTAAGLVRYGTTTSPTTPLNSS
jgi:hypothetical protein